MKNIRNFSKTGTLLLFITALPGLAVVAQQPSAGDKKPEFQFSVVKQIPATPVKSQASTSTCWCFATTSMLESEIIRLGKPEVGLSEMYTVNQVYKEKARQYVRFHGTCNFGPGGEQHDVLNSVRKYGLVPRDTYPGLNYGETVHRHGELHAALTAIVQAVVRNPNNKISPVWQTGFEGVLDAYLGEKPVSFSYNGKMVTPLEFSREVGINPDDYLEFTSFTHQPFYSRFVLEIPDNWAQEPLYNLPIDELMELIDYALGKGISLSWSADISDLEFVAGVARMMEDGQDAGNPSAREKTVGQDDRQKLFNSWELTDDHLMHLTGIARDQLGNPYYIEKNSWGVKGKYDGYSYVSAPFMRMRTVSVMVHRDGVPGHIAEKIGLKK